MVVEEISTAYQVKSEYMKSGGVEDAVYDDASAVQASMGVLQMWVDRTFRRCGFAHRLLDCARERFFFGHVVPRSQLAFSQLSSMGYACARAYLEDGEELLVYV